MSIENTYKHLLLDKYIQTKLQEGVAISVSTLETEIQTLNNTYDLSKPRFVAEDHHVAHRDSSSSSKFNNTFNLVRLELQVLYTEMKRLTQVAINSYERWNIETSVLEKRLIDIEDRVENLLFITQDSTGYYNFVLDNFTDMSLVDSTLSDIGFDLTTGTITLHSTDSSLQRVMLENLDITYDLSFKVRTTVDFVTRIDTTNNNLDTIFSQDTSTWWTTIEMNTMKPVTTELTVRLDPNHPISISKIIMILHDSMQSGNMNITPLYSTDNTNWKKLPTESPSQQVRSKALFTFKEIETQWIKFILTKDGPDPGFNETRYNYQFGFESISFWRDSYPIDTAQSFYSIPLFVTDEDNKVTSFQKLLLNACEIIETDTSIRYYLTTSNDPNVPVTSSTVWIPLDPQERIEKLYPFMITVGETTEFIFGDTEDQISDSEIVGLSYDATATILVNPAETFHLLHTDPINGIQDTVTNASSQRYTFANPEDKILNYQLATDVDINFETLKVFRNIGVKGLDATNPDHQVRGIQRGWNFLDPWYSTIVDIQNPNGVTIDFGSNVLFVDDEKKKNNVLFPFGVHKVKIHKDNWFPVEPQLSSLDELKKADSKYPFNHKLLIEGYDYGDAYSDIEEKIYSGVDLFSELFLQKISKFDFFHNVAGNQYSYFAFDIDAPGTHTGGNVPTTVFLVKDDLANPDSQNERFMIKFHLRNQAKKYFRFRADLTTKDQTVTPVLQSYRVKLGD